VAVVGGGIAGILLAHRLTDDPDCRVLLLEAGGDGIEPAMQETYEADVVGLPYTGHTEGRFRAFGGSSLRWGGGMFPFRSIDFETREWVPYSGWPIQESDLSPHYRAVQQAMGLNELPFDGRFLAAVGADAPSFEDSALVYRFAKWAPFRMRNLAATLGRTLLGRKNLRLVRGATATSVELDPEGGEVGHLVLRLRDGTRVRAVARQYVVCGGGIESPRLLLASRSVAKEGVGNRHGVVGRYFQDHFSTFAGVFRPDDRKRFLQWAEPYFRQGTQHSMKLELADEAQRIRQVLNGHLHFVFEAPPDSGFAYVRSLLRRRQAGSKGLGRVPPGRLAADMFDLVRLAWRSKAAGRRGAPRGCEFRVLIDTEQAPNPDSRLALTDRLDAAGMPRLGIDWRSTDLEARTLQAVADTFDGECARLGLGHVAWHPETRTQEWVQRTSDAYHHTGATRMGTDPRTSVVTRDLQVHGVHNLYVASGSVLPTNSGSGPTMTVMSLTLRLAEHLLRRLGDA
jgi:choline dehydrogenase-like flavoprotein